ncbi:MAG: HAD family hydrolase, partial [Blautia sp.]|nr:HAD family hydrolase [Blautia sp.]
GARVILATNPLFPMVATYSRIRWAGLTPEDFELITTYDNSTTCKPNPAYYLEILEKTGLRPEECLMVGNDVGEDMVAETLGMKVFLLTDCLINLGKKDISAYPHGGFPELFDYFRSTFS